QGDWNRAVRQDDGNALAENELFGLVEMTDNNPLVCADRFVLPSPVAILASIAVGPLIDAGLLFEPPTLLSSLEENPGGVFRAFVQLGWLTGATIECQQMDLQGAIALTAISAIRTPDRLEDLDDLYEERFGRSFFIHRHEEGDWDVALAKGSENAYY